MHGFLRHVVKFLLIAVVPTLSRQFQFLKMRNDTLTRDTKGLFST